MLKASPMQGKQCAPIMLSILLTLARRKRNDGQDDKIR